MWFFVCLVVLFFLSQILTKSISLFLHKRTKNIKFSVWFLSVLFLPGTIIHELSHALMAGVLHVPVGHMEFLPRLDENNLKLGSVQVGQTDHVRRFFIGTAPFFVGTALLLSLIWLIQAYHLISNLPFLIAALYGVFVISNTMFSSKKDMEGAIEFFVLVVAVLSVLYFLGIPIFTWGNVLSQNSTIEGILNLASKFLLVPIGIDVILIAIFKILR